MDIEALEKIVETSVEAIDILAYSFDASQLKGSPSCVIWPKTAKEVQKVIKFALEQNAVLVPRGGGTGLAGGAVPLEQVPLRGAVPLEQASLGKAVPLEQVPLRGAVPDGAIVVDLSKMRGIEIDPSKKEAIVMAGTLLDELNNELENYNLVFPVQPSSHGVATIGGIVSTNAEGNHAIKWGKVGDWVADIEAVNGNGKIVHSKDFCGSEGIFGIITKVTLRLTTPPKKTSITLKKINDYDELIKTINKLDGKAIAIEFLDRKTAELLGKTSMIILAEFEGDEGEIKGDEVSALWEIRDGAYPTLAAKGYPLIEDPEIKRENLITFLKWLEENNIPVFGHIGIGVLHPCFGLNDSDKISKMMKKVEELDGKVTGEHGIGRTKKKFLKTTEKIRLEKLKKSYDPKGIINGGNVIG